MPYPDLFGVNSLFKMVLSDRGRGKYPSSNENILEMKKKIASVKSK